MISPSEKTIDSNAQPSMNVPSIKWRSSFSFFSSPFLSRSSYSWPQELLPSFQYHFFWHIPCIKSLVSAASQPACSHELVVFGEAPWWPILRLVYDKNKTVEFIHRSSSISSSHHWFYLHRPVFSQCAMIFFPLTDIYESRVDLVVSF